MTREAATIIAALIVSVPGVLAVILGAVNRAKLQELHLTLNSRLTEMLGMIATSNQEIGRQKQVDKMHAAIAADRAASS